MSTKPEDDDASESKTPRGLDHKGAFRQREVYQTLKEEGELSCQEVAERLGVGSRAVRSALQRLERDDEVVYRPSLKLPNRRIYRVSDDE